MSTVYSVLSLRTEVFDADELIALCWREDSSRMGIGVSRTTSCAVACAVRNADPEEVGTVCTVDVRYNALQPDAVFTAICRTLEAHHPEEMAGFLKRTAAWFADGMDIDEWR